MSKKSVKPLKFRKTWKNNQNKKCLIGVATKSHIFYVFYLFIVRKNYLKNSQLMELTYRIQTKATQIVNGI